MDVFKLLGTIAVDASEANKTIDDTTGRAEKSESRMSSAFKKIGTAVVAAFATDKIIDFGKACVDASATVAAEQSSFEQIMGDYADTAKEKVAEIADATGMVDTRLTPYMTSMTAKFKGLGYDIGDSTDFAQQGLTIAADAAAFWDKSLDDSMGALNSFVNGSYEGGEAIGLFANDTQMAAYAVEKGLVSESKEWANLDEKIKQATRLEYAENMQKQSGATGQAAKESGQYANVQANLTEKWRQFKATVGEPILQNIVLPAMDKLSGFITNTLQPGIEKFKTLWGDELYPAITKTGSYIKDKFMAIFGNLKELVQKNSDKFDALKNAFGKVFGVVKDGTKDVLDFVEWITGSSEEAEALRATIEGLATGFLVYKGVMLAVSVAQGAVTTATKLMTAAIEFMNTTNPFGWVVLAVSGLVALESTLQGLPSSIEKDIEKFSQLDDEEQALIDSIGELTEEYNSWAKAKDEAISKTDAEFDYYKKLSDELETIVDKNGKVKKGYEDRAEFITTTLNDSLGTEIEITDGVVKKYDELIDKIDEVIEKKKAEAMLNANEAAYTEAIKNVGEAQEKYADALEKINATKSEMVPIQSALNDLEHMSAEEIENAYGKIAEANGITATYGDVQQFLSDKLKGCNSQLSEQETALDGAKTAYFDYNSTIQNYEGLSEAIISGDSEGIVLALSKMTEGFLTAEVADAESLERQTTELDSTIANMKTALKNGMPGVTQEQIDQLKILRDESKKEWDKALDDVSGFVGDAGTELNADFSSNGYNSMTTWGNGAAEGAQSVITTLSGLRSTFSDIMSGMSVNVTTSEIVASTKKLTGHAKGGIVTKEHIARVGEDGAEAIIPLEKNTEWIDNVAKRIGGNVGNNAVLEKLNELIDVIKGQRIYLDSGTLVGEIAPAMDGALGSISKLKRRGL